MSRFVPADPIAAGELGRACGISPVIAQLLLSRGLVQLPDAQRFLFPKLAHLTPPEGMADRTKHTIIAAAPAADSLVVVCDPTAEELKKLRSMVEQLARQAARPVSDTLLKWTAAGWQELK